MLVNCEWNIGVHFKTTNIHPTSPTDSKIIFSYACAIVNNRLQKRIGVWQKKKEGVFMKLEISFLAICWCTNNKIVEVFFGCLAGILYDFFYWRTSRSTIFPWCLYNIFSIDLTCWNTFYKSIVIILLIFIACKRARAESVKLAMYNIYCFLF